MTHFRWELLPLLWSILAACLGTLPWEQDFTIGMQRNQTRLETEAPMDNSHYQRSTVYFDSHGTRVEGWLYLPKEAINHCPVVIMAHGLGSQKDMGLHGYAERFVHAGLAVLVFDYRNFGGSDGEPRQLVDWKRHIEDWEAAVDFVKEGGLGQAVNPTKVALWGVSYSGGHVLMVASRMGNKLAAVVATEPHLTSRGQAAKLIQQRGILKALRLLTLAINDQMRGLFGLPAAYVRLTGSAAELSLLEMEGKELDLIRSRRPPHRIGGWQPSVPARMIFHTMKFEPLDHLDNITVPVLIKAGTIDYICAIEHVHKAMEILGDRAVLVEVNEGHNEMFIRGALEEEIAPIISFLKLHTGSL